MTFKTFTNYAMHSHLKGIVMLTVTVGLVQLLQKMLADNSKKQ